MTDDSLEVTFGTVKSNVSECDAMAVISKSIIVADRINGSIVNVAVKHGSSIIVIIKDGKPAVVN